ncbi:hypothetical protein E0L36_19015 [Streptomyces sp. AJS327]|uniref:hypothetical protein n=1 Tax=Streptomyces sp. AJS327 TaxID=2545265 RepID=UPI0015DF2BF6|nr:hypothetical protein [Streptomyces sp. AJS327]MBA0052887.1 hypothetical protein [Streptomyces sp. AJS327]
MDPTRRPESGAVPGNNPQRPAADRTARWPVPSRDGTQPGLLVCSFGVLRRRWRVLLREAFRVAGWCLLAALTLTVVAFLLAWPSFSDMWEGALTARRMEDSYTPDGSGVWLVLLLTLPLYLLLLGLGRAASQLVCARAVATDLAGGPDDAGGGPDDAGASGAGRGRARTGGARPGVGDGAGDGQRARLALVGRTHVLRGVSVGIPLVCGLLISLALASTVAPVVPDPVSGAVWVFAPVLGVLPALALGLGLLLAPAAAATDGLAPVDALHRSWSLVWRRTARGGTVWPRLGALALSLGLLTAGLLLVVRELAGASRDGVRSAVLSLVTENTYVADAAGALAPLAVALTVSAAVTLPLAHLVLAVLYRRLGADGRSTAGAGPGTPGRAGSAPPPVPPV